MSSASHHILFRCSKFCRPRIPARQEVILQIDRNLSRHEIYASINLLVRLALKEGAFVWIESNHGDKAAVHLKIDSESSDDEVVKISPTVAASLECAWLGLDTDHVAWIYACYDEPLVATTVVLRPIGRPVPKSIVKSQSQTIEYPPIGNTIRLLTPGSLISLLERSEWYTFEVQSINEQVDSTAEKMIYISSQHTEWTLEAYTSAEPIRRLPSVMGPLPHPSMPQIRNALLLPVSSPPSHKVLHVVGTRNNHVDRCVHSAADQLGMRYLSVNGLAAFAHTTGHSVTTGGLVDRLAGLKAALQHAQQSAPCVLHLLGMNEEVSEMDEPVRHMEEQRMWTALLSSLENIESPSGLLWRFAPRVIVVLSTSTPLKVGPWMQNVVFPSMSVSIPDENYARYLWDDDSSFDLAILLGRTACDLVNIKRMYNTEVSHSVQEPSAALADLCAELDAGKEAPACRIPTVRWENVGGLAHVRTEIMDAIELPLRHPDLFLGSNRSGILLYGPPGTGKTLVAKAVATECGLPFFSVKGPELLGSYVGESEAAVRQIFETARSAAQKNKPDAAILFFDELDSLAPRRGGVGDGGGVMERVVATLLSELDGRQTKGRVFTIGATNRPDLLDPSLLRPGRLDRLVYLGLATSTEDRAKILTALIHKFKLEDDPLSIATRIVDSFPPNLSGADFSAIASGALMRSLQRLCLDAESELQQRQQNSSSIIELNDILDEWDDARLVPLVTTDDLIEAAKEVNPSVSKTELSRYEALRKEFCSPIVM